MMNILLSSPFIFFILALLGIVLTIGIAVYALQEENSNKGVIKQQNFLSQLWNKEMEIAVGLGWDAKKWVIARIIFFIVPLFIGLSSQIPVLIFICICLGLFGFRWAVRGTAGKRRLKMERAFAVEIRNLVNRIKEGNTALDASLMAMAANHDRILDYVLEPLNFSGSWSNRLAEVAKRSQSPVITQICGVLMIGRNRDLDIVRDNLESVLIPALDSILTVQEENQLIDRQARMTTGVMVGVIGGLFLYISRNGIFKAFYATFAGQITLLVIAGFLILLIFLMKILIRPVPITSYNPDAILKMWRNINNV